MGPAIHWDAEVAWHAHLRVSAKAEVNLDLSSSGGLKDEGTVHKNADNHPKDARAHSKRLRDTHGSGDPVKRERRCYVDFNFVKSGNYIAGRTVPTRLGLGESRGLFTVESRWPSDWKSIARVKKRNDSQAAL